MGEKMIWIKEEKLEIAQFYNLLSSIALTVLGSLIIAFFSQIEIYVPPSPVPITLQTLGVFMVGYLFGKIRGTLSVVLYIFEGVLGLPFFAGGSGGLHHLLGPSGGYLIGFVFCAFLVGLSREILLKFNFITLFLWLTLSNLSIYIFGLLHLSIYIPKNLLLKFGFYPFIFGDFLKILIASTVILISSRSFRFLKREI